MSMFDGFRRDYRAAFTRYENAVNKAAEREAERTAPEKLQHLNDNAKLHEVNEAHDEFTKSKAEAKARALRELNQALDLLRLECLPLYVDPIKDKNRGRLEALKMRGSADSATVEAMADAMRGDVPALLALKSAVEGMCDSGKWVKTRDLTATPEGPMMPKSLHDVPELGELKDGIEAERARLGARLELLHEKRDGWGNVTLKAIPNKGLSNTRLAAALDALEDLGC